MEGALEPPPLPPPTPSDRPEPEPRPRLMPPPPDDLHLLLPIDFLNSRYAPKICLYSGRGDQVARVRLLLYVPSADGRLRMPVLIPVSHGERLFYRLRVRWTPGLWFLGAWLVVPGLVWMVLQGLYLLDWYSFTGTANLTVLAVTAGVAAAYIGGFLLDHRWIGRNCIVWRYRAALRAVDVTFPERHRQAFAAWFEALRAWDAAGRPVGDPDASEESWASGVAAGWDQDPTLLK